jgi:AcrR family transcriptional regulator
MRSTPVRREDIARAALEIIDTEGVAALSMRRVAGALDIGTMTLYGHVEDKDDLLDAAIDAASAPVELELSGTWREQLRTLVNTVRTALELHPALVHVRLLRPVVRPEALRFGEAGMSILRSAGLEPTEAAHAFRLLFTYTFGFTALSPSQTTAAARQRTDVAVASLPPEHFPALREHREAFVEAVAGDEAFAAGLEIILDGIAARAA